MDKDPGMITKLAIHDEDGRDAYVITHQQCSAIVLSKYDEIEMEMDYSEARALYRALGVMLSEVDTVLEYEEQEDARIASKVAKT